MMAGEDAQLFGVSAALRYTGLTKLLCVYPELWYSQPSSNLAALRYPPGRSAPLYFPPQDTDGGLACARVLLASVCAQCNARSHRNTAFAMRSDQSAAISMTYAWRKGSHNRHYVKLLAKLGRNMQKPPPPWPTPGGGACATPHTVSPQILPPGTPLSYT